MLRFMKNKTPFLKSNLFTNTIRRLSDNSVLNNICKPTNNYRTNFFKKNNTCKIQNFIDNITISAFIITTPLCIYLCRDNKDLRKYPLGGSLVITIYNGVYWFIVFNKFYLWPVLIPLKVAFAIDYFIINN